MRVQSVGMLLGITCAQPVLAAGTSSTDVSPTANTSAMTTAASEPLTVAVLDVRAAPGTEGVAKALTTLLTSELGNRPGFRTVSHGELKGLLAHQADQRLLGCDKPDCYADIGKLLQAKLLDFGVAKVINSDTTDEGTVFGTVKRESASATTQTVVGFGLLITS